MLLLAGGFAIFGYDVVMFVATTLGLEHTFSAFVAAWMANVTFLVVSLAMMRLNSERTSGAAPA
jgi:lipopolysaccharide export LptBFGC system permease protein LptF